MYLRNKCRCVRFVNVPVRAYTPQEILKAANTRVATHHMITEVQRYRLQRSNFVVWKFQSWKKATPQSFRSLKLEKRNPGNRIGRYTQQPIPENTAQRFRTPICTAPPGTRLYKTTSCWQLLWCALLLYKSSYLDHGITKVVWHRRW